MGFEVVVRPVVLPNIRPRPAQTLPPADDPEKGFCTIKGNPAHEVSFSNSWNMSMSKSHQVEISRRFDDVRVYQTNDDGTVNKDNFVDVEVATKIQSRGGNRPDFGQGDPSITGSKNPKGNSTEIAQWYARQLEQNNIEIRERDKVRKNEENQ